jgi:uncharacterized protein YkwD
MALSKKLTKNLWWILFFLGIVVLATLFPGGVLSAMPKPVEKTINSTEPIKQPTDAQISYVPLNDPVYLPLYDNPEPEQSVYLPLYDRESDQNNPLLGGSVYLPLYDSAAIDHYKPLLGKTPTPVTPTPTPMIHTVQRGEILASVALKYDITTEAILLANQLASSSNITVGQKLIIPEKPTTNLMEFHEVKAGEKLLGIAAKYRSSVEKILVANPMLDELKIGMVITVPVVFALAPTPAPVGSLTPVYHVVLPGESPLSIADQYNVSVEVLLATNQIINPRLMRIGTKLLIPPPDGLTLSVPITLHEIKEGETLIGLVSKYGSSIRDILFTNPHLKPDAIKSGELIAIPVIFPPKRPKPQPAGKPSVLPTPPANISTLAQQIVEVLNDQRVAHGLSPFKVDDKLAIAATIHAQDMVVQNFFAHINPNGQTLRQRLIENGFSSNIRAGENIQRNNQPASQTVNVAVKWLMNSSPHRKNILHESYTRVGVGVVKSEDVYTIVMDFVE